MSFGRSTSAKQALRHVANRCGARQQRRTTLLRITGERQGEHVHRLTPHRVSTLLALEVKSDGKTAAAQESAGSDPTDGSRQRLLGRGTDCQ